jgi:hypothetical protein
VIKGKVILSDGKEVVEALIGYGEPIKAVLEASYNWGKMCRTGWIRSQTRWFWPTP